MEIWRDVKGFEGVYAVSNLGRVKSLDRIDARGWKRRERIIKTGIHGKNKNVAGDIGYLCVHMQHGSKRKTSGVHRLVAEAFLAPDRDRSFVNHKDSNKHNNRISNLEWSSQSENVKHAYDSGGSAHRLISVEAIGDNGYGFWMPKASHMLHKGIYGSNIKRAVECSTRYKGYFWRIL